MSFGSAVLRDQLSLSTWLLIGAGAQTVCLAVFPLKYVAAATFGALAFLLTRTVLQAYRVVRFTPSPPILPGRLTARPPASLDPQPIVVFILGFQSSHPLGKLAPGVKEVGEYFTGTMREAAAEKGSSGFLGSSSLTTMDGDSDNAFITISYWCELDKLEKFSKQGVHLKAIKWWNEVSQKYPHLGIMHETYNCPAGSYETIYQNFRPFGMIKTSYEIDNELGEKEVVEAELVREGAEIETMYGRMSRREKHG